jgi:hypothetical protein
MFTGEPTHLCTRHTDARARAMCVFHVAKQTSSTHILKCACSKTHRTHPLRRALMQMILPLPLFRVLLLIRGAAGGAAVAVLVATMRGCSSSLLHTRSTVQLKQARSGAVEQEACVYTHRKMTHPPARRRLPQKASPPQRLASWRAPCVGTS